MEYEDNVQRVLALMRDTFGDTFKEYYDGDPEAIPLFNLPCIIVTQNSDETTEAAMGQDDVEDEITIKVVLNKRDDFNGSKVDPLNMTERKIRDFISLRDETTGEYVRTSVKGAIRSDLLEGVEAVAPTLRVNYGINPRVSPNKTFADLTAEGHVTFGIQFSVDTYE